MLLRLRRKSLRSIVSGISTYVEATVLEPFHSLRSKSANPSGAKTSAKNISVKRSDTKTGEKKTVRVPYLVHFVANQRAHTSPQVTEVYIPKRSLRDVDYRHRRKSGVLH